MRLISKSRLETARRARLISAHLAKIELPKKLVSSHLANFDSEFSSSHLVSPILKIISSHLARDGEIFVSFHLYFEHSYFLYTKVLKIDTLNYKYTKVNASKYHQFSTKNNQFQVVCPYI